MFRRRMPLQLLVLWLLALGAVFLAPAADATPAPWARTGGLFSDEEADGESGDGEEVPTVEELTEKRREVEAEIEALRSRIAAGEVETADAQAARLRGLEKIASLLGRQITEVDRSATLESRAAENEEDRRAGFEALVDHEPPFGFDDLDGLLARLDAFRTRSELLDDTIAAGTEALDEAESRLDQAEQSRRQAKEKWENASGSEKAKLEADLDAARRTARLAREESRLQRLQLQNDRRERELIEERRALLGDAVGWVRDNLQPSEEALQKRLDQLAEEQDSLRGRLEGIRREIQRDQSRLLRAEARLGLEDEEGEAEPSGAQEGETGDGETTDGVEIEDPSLRAQTETLRTELDLADRRSHLIEDRIERRDALAELWRTRHRLVEDPPVEEQRELARQAEKLRSELERDRRLLRGRAEDLRAELRQVEDRLIAAELPDDVGRWLRRRQETYREQIDLVEEDLSDLATALELGRRVESEAEVESLDVSELASASWNRVRDVWNWEIASVEDRSITLGKVIIAFLLLIVGYRVSKRLSQVFGRVLQQRFGLSSGAAHALQNLAFYVLVVIFFLWALQLVSIPITVFALLGGVAAIGLGFGSQNVVNNFISGLILLVERPIKVGDLIEVEGTLGSVERIGLRSARVRAGDNTHVIVPNSTFLEQKVLNWTISDDIVRTEVDVGVAYGSPVETVRDLMVQAMEEEPAVAGNMPKEVMFMSFGDNALVFRAYFWIRVQGFLDTHRSQSKLRFRIDQLFRDAGITIAFPQRDVHLDSLSPVEVRMVRDAVEPSSHD